MALNAHWTRTNFKPSVQADNFWQLQEVFLFLSMKQLSNVLSQPSIATMSTTMYTANQPCSRVLGATERGMCLVVPSGTGITVLALLLSKSPDPQVLQTALHSLQNSHPILRSKLHHEPSSRTFSFVTPSVSDLQVKSFDQQSTVKIIHDCTPAGTESLSPFQLLVEHEMNLNPWEKSLGRRSQSSSDGSDLFQATMYELEDGRWVVVLKVHAAACDPPATAALLREVLRLMNRLPGVELEIPGKGEVKLGIEDYVPTAMRKRSLWARGASMIGYSLSAFRLSNIDFVDPRSKRRSQLVRLHLEPEETTRLLEGCRNREIKLFGVLEAAALMAARLCKRTTEGQREKYAVVTSVDCRASLEPVLTTQDVGNYHSAIINTHNINGREQLWQLAKRIYKSFKDAKNGNKHLLDIPDLNFLLCKVIENPSLTNSLRTSFISMYEEVALYETDEDYEEIGVEDYMVCSSIHGIGPSLSLCNGVRDGRLDCTGVYPAPLHSRVQMQELVDHMKRILVDASYSFSLDDDDGKVI